MLEISARIIKQRIISSDIFISQNISQKFELNVECRAKLKTSREVSDKSLLLNMELNITDKEEELKIGLVADFVFELEETPEDYNEIAEQKLVPMARKGLLDSLDEMLAIMGYRKMGLSKMM